MATRGIPDETLSFKSYELNQPRRVVTGGRILRESHAVFLSKFIASRNFNPQVPLLCGTIKQGMVFDIVSEKDGRFLIRNSEFFNGNPAMAIEINKDGSLAKAKPLYSLIYLDNWDRAVQKAWAAGSQDLFRRASAPGAYDYELIYRGASDGFIYAHYRERIPGTDQLAYQEILKLPGNTEEFYVNGNLIKKIGEAGEEAAFAVLKTEGYRGYPDFAPDMLAENPSLTLSVHKPLREMPAPDNPRAALYLLLGMFHEKYYGLFYDRLDSYTRGRFDTLIEMASKFTADADELPRLNPRARFCHFVKNGTLTFTLPQSESEIQGIAVKNGKALIELKNPVSDESLYMTLENQTWKLRIAENAV